MADELPECFDPYLRYAIASEFKNFEFFDDQNAKLFLFVELKSAGYAERFETAMVSTSHKDFGAEFGPISPSKRYLTMRARKAAVESSSFSIWNENVSRVELSLPLQPTHAAKITPRNQLRKRYESAEPRSSLLIGVIDDGCPFAAAQFLGAASGAGGA